MEVADILSERSVLACTGIMDKPQLFAVLAEAGAAATGLDAETVREAVMTREALGSTGLGNGIAVPHGKCAGLSQVTAVFARLDTPIEFDAVDDQPVDIVVMLLAPNGAGADHLKALSCVARLLRTEDVVDALRANDEPGALYAILTAARRADAA